MQYCGAYRKKERATAEAHAEEKLISIFETARRQADFGNGRFVRNVIERAKMAHSTRLLAKDYKALTPKDITTLCAEDIESPVVTLSSKQPIGFV